MGSLGQKTAQITEAGSAVVNPQGFVIYSPPATSCGLNFTQFGFLASDSSLASNISTIYIDIYCTPGSFFPNSFLS